MNDLDALLGAFRSRLAEAATPDAVAIADAARAARPREALTRRAALAFGAVALASVASVLAVMLVRAPTAPTSHAAAPARVDWGMFVTVRVTPDPGVAQADAVAHAVETLTDRANRRDVGGFEVRPGRKGTILVMKVPAAEAQSQFDDFLDFSRVSVISGESELARASTLRGLAESVRANRRPGLPDRWYVIQHSYGSGISIKMTKHEAQTTARRMGPGAQMLAVPVDMRVAVDRPQSGRLVLLRLRSLASGPAIRDVSVSGNHVALTLDPASMARVSREAGRAPLIVLEKGFVGQIVQPVTAIGPDGVSATFPALDVFGATFERSLPRPGLDARLTLEHGESYGAQPPLPGATYVPRGQFRDDLVRFRSLNGPYTKVLTAPTV